MRLLPVLKCCKQRHELLQAYAIVIHSVYPHLAHKTHFLHNCDCFSLAGMPEHWLLNRLQQQESKCNYQRPMAQHGFKKSEENFLFMFKFPVSSYGGADKNVKLTALEHILGLCLILISYLKSSTFF